MKTTIPNLRRIIRNVIKENYGYDAKFDKQRSEAWSMYQQMEQQGMDKEEIYNRLVARYMREVVDSIFGY